MLHRPIILSPIEVTIEDFLFWEMNDFNSPDNLIHCNEITNTKRLHSRVKRIVKLY